MNSYKQSLYISLIRVVANVFMLGALFLGMFMAFHAILWPSELVFCAYFFGITIPVWILAWILIKWVRKKWPAEQTSLITLPGYGETLVRWSHIPKTGKSKLWL